MATPHQHQQQVGPGFKIPPVTLFETLPTTKVNLAQLIHGKKVIILCVPYRVRTHARNEREAGGRLCLSPVRDAASRIFVRGRRTSIPASTDSQLPSSLLHPLLACSILAKPQFFVPSQVLFLAPSRLLATKLTFPATSRTSTRLRLGVSTWLFASLPTTRL